MAAMPHNLFCISCCILMCVSCGQIKLNCPFSFRYTFEFSREREQGRILLSSIKPIKHSFHWITYVCWCRGAEWGISMGIRLHTHMVSARTWSVECPPAHAPHTPHFWLNLCADILAKQAQRKAHGDIKKSEANKNKFVLITWFISRSNLNVSHWRK